MKESDSDKNFGNNKNICYFIKN